MLTENPGACLFWKNQIVTRRASVSLDDRTRITPVSFRTFLPAITRETGFHLDIGNDIVNVQ